MDSIVVFSHLRWNFVYQRPQHLLSRLAKHFNIIYFEEPMFDSGTPRMDISSPCENITVCRPSTPIVRPGFNEAQLPYLRKMVKEMSQNIGHADPHKSAGQKLLVWFYTPMALPLLSELDSDAVVFDCMDELSAFKNPPPALLECEANLLATADIVFTGGPSLYRAKMHRHPNVHCFPSSVDAAHFRRALDRNIVHPAVRSLKSPRLGFYGVIDERFDIELIMAVAVARPDWQIVLVGPVVKINPETLPQLPNIHYFGQRSYEELPQFLAGWDVCLMPFAMNESTRYISPTKSLEYMAAELPIVSTPIRDVVDLHSDVVLIASDQQSFIDCCDQALSMSAEEGRTLVRAMRQKLSSTSWDSTAQQMQALLENLDTTESLMTQSVDVA